MRINQDSREGFFLGECDAGIGRNQKGKGNRA